MARDVVEVVARFGETVLDVAYVEPGGVYCIGSARVPVGAPARGVTRDIELALVTLSFTRMTLPRTRMPRRRPALRPLAYLLASLIVQLSICFVAFRLAPFEQLVIQHAPRFRYVHVGEPPPEPVPKPVVKPVEKPVDEPKQERAANLAPRAARIAKGAEQRESTPSHRFGGELVDLMDEIDVKSQVGELTAGDLYNEDDANAKRFGGGRRFDPTTREGWGTAASGQYVTHTFDIKLCPDKSCKVTGPFPASGVRSYLHAELPAINDCYVRHASAPGTVVLEFTITRRFGGDGAVKHAKGRGLGETGPCVAAVVAAIDFKAFEADTHVRYPIRFN